MAYDICKKCERFFKKSGKQYCDKCDKQLKESREKMNSYLETNPNASIIEIVKEAGVSLKDVNIFLETSGVASYSNDSKTLNLRDQEIEKKEEIAKQREKFKMKNKFSTRRLRD